MNERVFAAMETPLFFPSRSINRIKITVPTSEKQNAIGECRGRMHDVAGFKVPALLARRRVDRVNIPVAAAEINEPLSDDRTGQINIERISNRLIFRLHAV